jgi:hypothetical protein
LKYDHSPLLAPGKHYLSLPDLNVLTVQFDNPNRRLELFAQLENLHRDLDAFAVRAELWVDGSFMTVKPEPNDIDGCIAIHIDQFQALSHEAKAYLKNFEDDAPSSKPSLDFFLNVYYNREDPRSKFEGATWESMWSRQHDGKWLKGYAIVPIGRARYELF